MNYNFNLPLYHNAISLYNVITFFKTFRQLEDYAVSIGYELSPDYRGYEDENDHPNYQQFFSLHILFGEIAALNPKKGDVLTVYYDQTGDEVLAFIADSDNDDMTELNGNDFHNIVF